jgi:hypothetical protein
VKAPSKIPTILSEDEVARMIDSVHSVFYNAIENSSETPILGQTLRLVKQKISTKRRHFSTIGRPHPRNGRPHLSGLVQIGIVLIKFNLTLT